MKTIAVFFMFSCSLALSAQHYPASDIENLTATTGKAWKVETGFGYGSVLFIDRAYFASTLNKFFEGATHIRPANDDRSYAKDDLASFTVKSAADVYIGHSQGIKNKPNWYGVEYDDCGPTNEFGDFNVVSDNNEVYWFRKKSFPAGSTVTVGKNGDGTRSMYFIIVKPAGSSTRVNNPALANEIKIMDGTISAPLKGNFAIYNATGSVVMNAENVDKVDANLNTGIYILQFAGEDGSRASKKFVIK
jgi:hypothetical protein